MRRRRAFDGTVFERLPADASSDWIIATLSHRTAAVLYALVALWGWVSFFDIIPTIESTLGQLFQSVYSVCVFVVAAVACAGATFFPRTGRMEMYSAAMLTVLMSYWVFLLGEAAWNGVPGRWPAAVYAAGHLVIPAARAVFIYLTLVRREPD